MRRSDRCMACTMYEVDAEMTIGALDVDVCRSCLRILRKVAKNEYKRVEKEAAEYNAKIDKHVRLFGGK